MSGVQLIKLERDNQLVANNFTLKHDLQHRHGTLSCAAAAYIRFAKCDNWAREVFRHNTEENGLYELWPFPKAEFKPSQQDSLDCRIKELSKAGALIAAEIDLLLYRKKKGLTLYQNPLNNDTENSDD